MSEKPPRNLYRAGKHRVEVVLNDEQHDRLLFLAAYYERTLSKTIAALITGKIQA